MAVKRKFILFAVLALTTACSKPDRNDEAVALSTKIVKEGLSDSNHALERVDSAEHVGVFTALRANTIKAIVYSNAGRRRMAAYYAEKAVATEAGQAVTTAADSNLYCKVRYVLADGAYINGEYGKSLAIAKEILAFVGDGTTPKNVETKCRALMQMADCESKLGHIAESEQLFLQCIDDLMVSTQHATDYGEIDPLIYTLLSLNDLYIDNKMPEKALSLIEKMDTAMNRLTRCSTTPDWAIKKRRKNVTISKAMVYAANHQREQADVEQLQEIKQQEEEIASKHQSLVLHRIILASVFLVCLLISYLLWRSYNYNKVLSEKNRKLYEEIEQRRQEQQQEMELLQAAPEERLTTEQQLYRRLCTLMDEQQPYTDETLNRDMLASLLGTNVKYVEQAIRQCSKGETVSDFINRYRLEHITRLLKTTDDPIAIIGELSGIPSRATLARLFRNAYGMTPTEYRKI